MSNLYKLKQALIFICILFLISFLVKQCKENKELAKKIDVLKSNEKIYKNKIGTLTLSKEVLTVKNSELKKYISEQDKKLTSEFSKVKTLVKWKQYTKFDTTVVFKEPIECDFKRSDSIKTKWYNFTYEIDKSSLKLSKMSFTNEITIITGTKRKWFLGKETITTDITNSNPYVSNSEMQSFEVVKPKRWYDTTVFKFGIGFLVGAYIMK